MRGLVGVNMTSFFNRELFMYSLGDIHFKKPISLKKMAYITGFFIGWTLPLILIMGLQINVYFAVAAIAPPLILGNLAVKPVFGGKNLIEFTRTMIKFVQEPKGWNDLAATSKTGEESMYVENEIWISRRRELAILEQLSSERKKKK